MSCLPHSKAILLLLFFFIVNAIDTKAQYCPPNIDFEQGNLNDWHCSVGGCCPISTPTVTGPVVNRHTIMSGTGVDPYGGFPVVAPGGGKYSLKLGNKNVGGEAERAVFYIHVPYNNTKFLVIFNYAVVLQDPHHQPFEQPRFEVKAYDSATGDVLPCVNFSFVASSSLPGFVLAPGGTGDVFYKPWSATSMDLTPYQGKTVALDFATGDCLLKGHFGYAYVDIDCSAFTPVDINCAGTPTVTLNGPPGFQLYRWMDDNYTTILGTTEDIIIPTPTQSTKYHILVSPYTGFGCPDTMSVSLTVTKMTIQTSKDTTACNGSDMPLDVHVYQDSAQPFTYSWTPSTGLSCTTCANPIANAQNTITYTVTVTDTNGCSRSKNVTVTRVKRVSAKVAVPSDTVCQYSYVTLKNSAVNPATAAHFWNVDTNGHIHSGNGSPTAIVSWGTPGIKRIIVHTNDEYCNIADTAYVYVKPASYAYFDMDADACINTTVDIRPVKQNALYYWDIEGKTVKDTIFKTPIQVSYNTPGKKHISLRVKDLNGCFSIPYDTVLTVHEFPVSDIYVSEKEICYGDTVTLNTIKQNRYIYAWTPVNRFVTNSESSVKAEILSPQMVRLEVANEWGCRVYDSFYVQPQHCCNVYFPDAFTPNGDGHNDRFRPISAGHHKIQSFMIANRWGDIIYRSTDQYDGWDGTYKGIKQDNGVYFYYLKYDCTDGQPLEAKGSFLLIR